jgi:hypothetical protein
VTTFGTQTSGTTICIWSWHVPLNIHPWLTFFPHSYWAFLCFSVAADIWFILVFRKTFKTLETETQTETAQSQVTVSWYAEPCKLISSSDSEARTTSIFGIEWQNAQKNAELRTRAGTESIKSQQKSLANKKSSVDRCQQCIPSLISYYIPEGSWISYSDDRGNGFLRNVRTYSRNNVAPLCQTAQKKLLPSCLYSRVLLTTIFRLPGVHVFTENAIQLLSHFTENV